MLQQSDAAIQPVIQPDSQSGVFNFRSVLRKTNFDPQKTLRRVRTPDEDNDDDTTHKFDFRSVLKRTSLDRKQKPMNNHILT